MIPMDSENRQANIEVGIFIVNMTKPDKIAMAWARYIK